LIEAKAKTTGTKRAHGNVVARSHVEVCAHSMRRLHSTLAMEAGMSANVVAASMGHESAKTTLRSYAKPDGVAAGRTKKVTAGLMGNSPKSGSRRNIVPVSFRKRKRRLAAASSRTILWS